MGAVFQLCHFKSKKTQTAPNCLLPRELSTPQKPSSGQQCTLTVTDTETGQTRSYDNPLGNCAPAVTDTSAFATCP